MREIGGVLPVLAVPFDSKGNVDFDSIPRLVEHCIASKAHGIVIFGLASELYKLNDSERIEILKMVLTAANSRIPVIVGTEHSGTQVGSLGLIGLKRPGEMIQGRRES